MTAIELAPTTSLKEPRRIRRLLDEHRATQLAYLEELARMRAEAHPAALGDVQALLETARDALHDLDAALVRLESGRYGTCTGCGEPIAAARLEALPATALCLPCQRARERRYG